MSGLYTFRDQRRPLATGVFFSPASGSDGEYRQIRTRRWVALSGVPVVPTITTEDCVECSRTGLRLHPSVIDPTINAHLRAHMVDAVRTVVSSMANVDGPPDAIVRSAALASVRAWDAGYSEGDLDDDLARADSAGRSPGLVHMSDQLENPGKCRLLLAAAHVMVADSAATDAERALLSELGYLLRVNAAEVRRVERDAVGAHDA